MQLVEKHIKKLAGKLIISDKNNVNLIFDKLTCDFLNQLSKNILNSEKARKFTDLISFAFWIRNKNILRIKNFFMLDNLRIGRGIAFHITPSNVPLNFAYSFVMGLLSGNSNIIRISNRYFEQNDLFLKIINKLFKKQKFKSIKNNNLFLKYDYNDDSITKKISLFADCRIIWGSDKTVKEIRKLEIKSSCVELIFPDKYSICIINSNSILKLSKNELNKLVLNFISDAFLFNQHSCTSPHLIIWVGKKNLKYNEFWNTLNLLLSKKKFNLGDRETFERYSKFCEFSSKINYLKSSSMSENFYRMTLSKLEKNITDLRYGNGYFFEYFCNDVKKIMPSINEKFQTVTYFGFQKDYLKNIFKTSKPRGINRFVPLGRASEFSEFWDGYDLIRNLSKKVDLK